MLAVCSSFGIWAAHDQDIQLESLPKEVRKKVVAFIDPLMEQWEQKQKEGRGSEEPARKRRTAGLMKGQMHISADLDEPLGDFKEYME